MKTAHILKPQSYAHKLQKSKLGPYHGNSSMVHTGIAMVRTELWLLERKCATLDFYYMHSFYEIIIWDKTCII